MAFNVTPTSGASPYTFTAELTSKESFGNGYDLRFFTSVPSVGSCPLPADTNTPATGASILLLEEGVYESPTDVAEGSCRTFVLRIFDDLENVIDEQFVNVDNI